MCCAVVQLNMTSTVSLCKQEPAAIYIPCVTIWVSSGIKTKFFFIWNQPTDYKIFYKLAMTQTCGRTSVMRSPTARSRSPNCRSAGHRHFSLRTKLSRGMGWGRWFEWVASFIRCLVLVTWMTSCTVGIPWFSWIIALLTYHGAWTIARNILDWHFCTIGVLDLQALSHNSKS